MTGLTSFEHTFQCPGGHATRHGSHSHTHINEFLANNPGLEILRLHSKDGCYLGGEHRLNRLRILSLTGFPTETTEDLQAIPASESSLSQLRFGGWIGVHDTYIKLSLGIGGLPNPEILTSLDFDGLQWTSSYREVRFNDILHAIVSSCPNLRRLTVIRLGKGVRRPLASCHASFDVVVYTYHPCSLEFRAVQVVSSFGEVTAPGRPRLSN